MPRELTPDEIASLVTNPHSYVTPQPAGYGTLFSSAVDRTQAALYGLGEAVGLDRALGLGLARQRRINEAAADEQAARFYADTGTPQSYRDINSTGDAAKWLAALGVQSLPHMAGLAAGAAGGTLLSGGNPLGGLAGALAVGSTLGTSYTLQDQRDEAGRTDLSTAVPLGVGYGLVDTLTGAGGVVTRVARGAGAVRNPVRALDSIGGVKGVAARTGASALRTGAEEAAGEVIQEGLSQLGRMSVNPSAGLLDGDAVDRYEEAAVSGFALGGVLGGAAGGWRRSAGYAAPRQPVTDTVTHDLLTGETRDHAPITAQPVLVEPRVVDSSSTIDTDAEVGLGLIPAINPYDAGGYVSAFQSGQETDVTSPQRGLFGTPDSAVDFAAPSSAPRPSAGDARLDYPSLPERDGYRGQQHNLFEEPPVSGAATPSIADIDPAERRIIDTRTQDLFARDPRAMLPTILNRATNSEAAQQSQFMDPRWSARDFAAQTLRAKMAQVAGGEPLDNALAYKLATDLAKLFRSERDVVKALVAMRDRARQVAERAQREVDLTPPDLGKEAVAKAQAKLRTAQAALWVVDDLAGQVSNVVADTAQRTQPAPLDRAVKPRNQGAAQQKADAVNSQAAPLADPVAEMEASYRARAVQEVKQAIANARTLFDEQAALDMLRSRLRAAGLRSEQAQAPTEDELAELRRYVSAHNYARAAKTVAAIQAKAPAKITQKDIAALMKAHDAALLEIDAVKNIGKVEPEIARDIARKAKLADTLRKFIECVMK